jgi:hypothetical protein
MNKLAFLPLLLAATGLLAQGQSTYGRVTTAPSGPYTEFSLYITVNPAVGNPSTLNCYATTQPAHQIQWACTTLIAGAWSGFEQGYAIFTSTADFWMNEKLFYGQYVYAYAAVDSTNPANFCISVNVPGPYSSACAPLVN